MAVPDKINQNEKSSATREPAAAWLPPAARQKKTQGPLGRKRKREARFCVERRSDDPEPRPVIANFLPIRPVGYPRGPTNRSPMASAYLVRSSGSGISAGRRERGPVRERYRHVSKPACGVVRDGREMMNARALRGASARVRESRKEVLLADCTVVKQTHSTWSHSAVGKNQF